MPPPAQQGHQHNFGRSANPTGRLMVHEAGNSNPQAHRQPPSKHPKDEDISPFAHSDDAFSPRVPFFRRSHKVGDMKRTQRKNPNRKPRKGHRDPNADWNDETTHAKILVQTDGGHKDKNNCNYLSSLPPNRR